MRYREVGFGVAGFFLGLAVVFLLALPSSFVRAAPASPIPEITQQSLLDITRALRQRAQHAASAQATTYIQLADSIQAIATRAQRSARAAHTLRRQGRPARARSHQLRADTLHASLSRILRAATHPDAIADALAQAMLTLRALALEDPALTPIPIPKAQASVLLLKLHQLTTPLLLSAAPGITNPAISGLHPGLVADPHAKGVVNIVNWRTYDQGKVYGTRMNLRRCAFGVAGSVQHDDEDDALHGDGDIRFGTSVKATAAGSCGRDLGGGLSVAAWIGVEGVRQARPARGSLLGELQAIETIVGARATLALGAGAELSLEGFRFDGYRGRYTFDGIKYRVPREPAIDFTRISVNLRF